MRDTKPSVDDIFESPKLLLHTAREAYSNFAGLLQEEYQRAALEYVADPDLLPGLIVHRYSIATNPPSRLRIEAYRFVSDIPHALDQAVFAASRALGSPPNKNKIYFPFANNPDDFDSLYVQKKGRCRDTHPSLIPTLRAYQPWWRHAETGTGDDVLRTIGKLSGPNKHQVIIDFAPEMVGSRNSAQADGFVWAQVVPPLRLDRFNAEFPEFLVPSTRNRTDFIAAVAPPTTNVTLGLQARVALCAKEATHIRLPIDDLLAEFLTKGAACVEGVETFTLDALQA